MKVILANIQPKLASLSVFDRLFSFLFSSSARPKTHSFVDQVAGVNYVFEEIDSDQAQMTGYGRNIRVGDYILLAEEKIRYQVQAIEYYSNPMNLWTAVLTKA